MRIGTVSGSLKVHTAAGDVSSGPVVGNVGVKTAAGDVNLAEARPAA